MSDAIGDAKTLYEMKNINTVKRMRVSAWCYLFKYNKIYKRRFVKRYGYNLKQLKTNQPHFFRNDIRINK